jgi:hypothetical protein
VHRPAADDRGQVVDLPDERPRDAAGALVLRAQGPRLEDLVLVLECSARLDLVV